MPKSVETASSVAFACFVALLAGASLARADARPESATTVRDTVVAMSLADAALPAADAAATPRRDNAIALKPETSRAMAQMQPARRTRTAAYDRVADRRIRFYHDPFFLVMGVAY